MRFYTSAQQNFAEQGQYIHGIRVKRMAKKPSLTEELSCT